MQVRHVFVSIVFSHARLHDGLEGGVRMTGADVMSEEKIGVPIILFLDPTSGRNHS